MFPSSSTRWFLYTYTYISKSILNVLKRKPNKPIPKKDIYVLNLYQNLYHNVIQKHLIRCNIMKTASNLPMTNNNVCGLW